jgi:hypothetical protein
MLSEECQYCPICGDVRLLDVPQFIDDQGEPSEPSDFPERACAECGVALFVDPVIRTSRTAGRAA